MHTPPNVIFVVVDTVRSDRVSAYGYEKETTPNLDSFAADATTFTDAVSQAAWSIPAHGSLLTGKYPADHGATTLAPLLCEKRYLPAILSGAGYETYGVSHNEYVRPLTGFGRGFDEFDPCTPVTVPPRAVSGLAPLVNWGTKTPRVRLPIEKRLNASRVAAPNSPGTEPREPDHLVARVADMLERAASPFFFFVNVIDAHLPRSPAPDHYERFVDEDLHEVEVVETERAHTFGEGMDERALRKMDQLYDADLRTMDEKLGELLEVFSRAGVLDESLVVLVSDHGEHLGEFGMVGHQGSLFEEVVSVPLAIQFPDGGPDRVEKQVELRRLFHTVLAKTGIEEFPDRSLASGVGDDVARGEFFTPMLDLDRLTWDREVDYDPALQGEQLTFRRDGESKRLQFGEHEWVFSLPESAGQPVSPDLRVGDQ